MPLGKSEKTPKQVAMSLEKRLAKQGGGYAQPGSGSGLRHKGDIKLDTFLFDSKHTRNSSITVTAGMLGKISAEARSTAREPGLIISLEVPVHVETDWAVIPYSVLVELLTQLKEDINCGSSSSGDCSLNIGGEDTSVVEDSENV